MSKDETGIWNFSLFIIPMLREIVLQILSIWSFQESLLSTIIPRNLMWETFSKGVSSKIISIGKASNVLLKSMYFVFWRLSDNLLALIHWVTCYSMKKNYEWKKLMIQWRKIISYDFHHIPKLSIHAIGVKV